MIDSSDACNYCGRTGDEARIYSGLVSSYCADGCGFYDHPKQRRIAVLTRGRLDELEDIADGVETSDLTGAELHTLVSLARIASGWDSCVGSDVVKK